MLQPAAMLGSGADYLYNTVQRSWRARHPRPQSWQLQELVAREIEKLGKGRCGAGGERHPAGSGCPAPSPVPHGRGERCRSRYFGLTWRSDTGRRVALGRRVEASEGAGAAFRCQAMQMEILLSSPP